MHSEPMPKQCRSGFVHLSHRDAMIRHAIKRLYQRKGILLSNPEYEAIADKVRSGAHPQVATDRWGRRVHRVEYRGAVVFAIWDAERDAICTFFPTLSWLENGKARGPGLACLVGAQ